MTQNPSPVPSTNPSCQKRKRTKKQNPGKKPRSRKPRSEDEFGTQAFGSKPDKPPSNDSDEARGHESDAIEYPGDF